MVSDLEDLAVQKGVNVIEPFAGLELHGGVVKILGPSQQYYEELLPHFDEDIDPKKDLSALGMAMKTIDSFIKWVKDSPLLNLLDDEDTTSVKMLYAASIPLTLGYGNNVELNGEVDDYKVYRKALKIEQIRRLYEENSKGGDQGNSLTILTYHQILENGSNASDHVNKVNFTEQIEYLNKSGFKGLTVAEYDQIRKTNSSIPKKSIIITFDDGWKSIYEKAFPILDNYSYVATNFIVTNYANGSSGYISYMNWSEVEDLKDKGWDVQSHSVSHKNLINLSEEEYRKQLNDSKTILKDKLNVDANSFAFPFSSSNQSYTEICGEYYDLCWTKATKASSPSYVYKNTLNVFSSLKRINIGFDTTLNWFKSMLGRDTDIEVEGNKTGYT